jgi:hypothetical protein
LARAASASPQLRHRLLADIARRGVGRDPDLGELRPQLDAVSLLDSHAQDGPADDAVARIRPDRERAIR